MSNPFPALKREIRVFISSTFSDMQTERNYLVKKIFPDIERECRKRNVEFIPLDLRWGITEEESRNGKVVEICINEIDRTRPFFIGLIGGRYGWVPGSGDDFDAERVSRTMPWIRSYIEEGISITEMEMRYGVLDSKDPVYANFFIRREKDIPGKYKETDSASVGKLDKLKKAIRAAAEDGRCMVADYGSVKSLGKTVRRQLMDMIDTLFPIEESSSVYDLYAGRQSYKVTELRRFHHPRVPDILEDIRLNRYVLLTASFYGAGLSAIAANEIPDEISFVDSDGYTHHPRVIRSFIDAEVYSVELLKRIFVNSLHKVYPDVDVPEIYLSLEDSINLKEIISRFPKEEYLWIIDSPENFSDPGERNIMNLVRETDFLLRLVVVSSDQKVADICQNNDFFIHEIYEPSEMDRRAITTNYLRYYGKSLSERQISAIIGSDILTNVKMLVMFLEILRNFGVYEDVDKFIHNFVTLDSEKDFYNRYLDYLENEFSDNVVAEIFRRLQLIDMGVSEKGIFRGLLKTRIEQSSFMGVIENLLSRRFNNYVLPTKSVLAEVVAERYPLSEGDYRRITRMRIHDYQERIDEIARHGRKSISDRIIGKASDFLMRGLLRRDDNGLDAERGMLRAAIIVLHSRSGNHRSAVRMLRHFGIMDFFLYRPNDMQEVFGTMKKHGFKPHSMISSLDIITEKMLLDDFILIQIWSRFAVDREEKELFYRKMKQKLLPSKIKRQLLEKLKDNQENLRFIDLWDENFDFENENLDSRTIFKLTEQSVFILTYRNRSDVSEILEKLKRTINKISPEIVTRYLFLSVAVYCAVRLNDRETYKWAVAEIQGSMCLDNAEQDLLFSDIILTMKNTSGELMIERKTLIEEADKLIALLNGLPNVGKSLKFLVSKVLTLYFRVQENGVEYPEAEISSLLGNDGRVIDLFFYNNRKDIASFLLPAFIR